MLQFNQGKTPQQNGMAKKMNHTFLDKAKLIMLENGTPNHLCAKAISTIPYMHNKCPTMVNHKVILKHILSKMKLDLSHLKVLGYHVCIHMSKKD
jgi:hypothetical protein